MKKCPYCGNELSDVASFCGKCGNSYKEIEVQKPVHSKYCSECGAETTGGMKFCGSCGSVCQSPNEQQLQNVQQQHSNQQQSYSTQQYSQQFNYSGEQGTITPTGNHQVNNTLIWIVAIMPIVGLIIEAIVANAAKIPMGDLWWITVSCNVILCALDEHMLKKVRPDISKFLNKWIFLIPVYLYRRAKALKQNLAYFIVWIVLFSIMMMVSLTIPALGSSAIISTVKNGHFYDYPNTSIGDALDNFLENEKWSSLESAEGDAVVEVTGNRNGYHMLVQFDVYDDTFEFRYAEIDGEAMNLFEFLVMLELVFE